MVAAVDPHRLIYSVVMLWQGVVPARRQLDQGHLIGRIAIDLVGAHEYERGFGRVLPVRLQQVQGAGGIDLEVVERSSRCQVMRGLSRAVNHSAWPDILEQLVDRVA